MKFNIPEIFKIKRKHKSMHFEEGKYVIDDNSSFRTLESYKAARTNIMFSLPKSDKGKIIVISSSEPAEGKTTTAINLAYTFSCTDSKVILIDCDLRKPRVHRYLKEKKDIGISNVLCGFCTLDEAIKKNVKGSLDCITVGETPANSTELLMSDEMNNVLEELSQRYDYIFIVTPPIVLVTDAIILAKKSSGMIIVARQDYSSYDMLDKTIEIIKNSNIKLLGFIMNCADKKNGSYYGYDYKSRFFRKYGYGYGYGYYNEYK